MKNNRARRLIAILLAVSAVAGIAVMTAMAGTADPVVTFDARAKSFSFSNVTLYTDAEGTRTYFDLFKDIKNAMPGDSFAQEITVKVTNAGRDTVHLTLKSENENEEYKNLLKSSEIRLLDGSREITGSLEDGVLLGSFTGGEQTKALTVFLTIPLTAGNQLQGLTGEIDWVFVAEIFPQEVVRPGDGEETDIPDEPVPMGPPELDQKNHYAYIIGRTETLVCPDAKITRAEVATIFFRMLTEESRNAFWSRTNPYRDVPSNAWYNAAVSTLTRAGIINGYADGRFGPNDFISRAEFAAMAVRFFEVSYDGADLFSDIALHWARDAINMAGSVGLINGYEDGTFCPQNHITRAEAMTVMNRTLRRSPDKDMLLAEMVTWEDNADTSSWYYAQVQEATNSHAYEMQAETDTEPAREIWTRLEPVRDWALLEREWATQNDAPSPGEVISSSLATARR